ncbi:MAG: L,D-transpeptidase [Proteobacteria bacterium]|nr:L,D-transpeptidase [Pseudomonadota bacterium]
MQSINTRPPGRLARSELRLPLLATVAAYSAACSPLACSATEPPRTAQDNRPQDAAAAIANPPGDAAADELEAPFPAEVRSVELKRSITVRMKPSRHAERYGTIAAGTRVAWKSVAVNDDCSKRWVEIEPHGWICESYLKPSRRRPHGVELPRLQPGEIVPGVYGKVTTENPTVFRLHDEALLEERQIDVGSVMVRRHGGITIEDVEYWLIDKRKREYIASPDIRPYRPSRWRGIRLGDDTGRSLPIGFPLSRTNASHSVPIYQSARDGTKVGKVSGRSPIPILETAWPAAAGDSAQSESDHGKRIALAYRIGEDRWVLASDMRIAVKMPPPPLTGPTERWLDLDLDQQVLVAYEGTLPVYVTLVSSGARKSPTETGIYRIWIKFSETDMSDLAGESPYSVATVPWTQFYAKDLALHTAYWHDGFGTARSHGCTNLSPQDARFLYFWSDPRLPPGWSMSNGTVEHPGSQIRIRSDKDPDPGFRGYAARVYEARAARQSGRSKPDGPG